MMQVVESQIAKKIALNLKGKIEYFRKWLFVEFFTDKLEDHVLLRIISDELDKSMPDGYTAQELKNIEFLLRIYLPAK